MKHEPEKEKVAVIRECYFKLTNCSRSAVILNQMIYWSQRVKDFDKFMKEEQERCANLDEHTDMPLTHGWIYKTAKDLCEETMLGISENTSIKHLSLLIDKGWIDRRKNPKHKWDKTYQYRVNLYQIQKDLYNLGYNMPEYKLFIPEDKANKTRSSGDEIRCEETENQIEETENQIFNIEEQYQRLQTKITNKDIPYGRKKKEKPKSVDKPSVQHGTVDSRFSLADSKEKKFSQILKNKKIEIPNIERKDLKKNFVGNPAKFKDKKARLGNSQVEKGEYPGAWDALHSLPDDNPHKKLGLAYIEHETKKWDFSNTKNPEVVYKMFCLEYILDAPNALHFLYCLKKDLLKDDLDAYHTRNGLRKSNPIDESKDLLEMWENKY